MANLCTTLIKNGNIFDRGKTKQKNENFLGATSEINEDYNQKIPVST